MHRDLDPLITSRRELLWKLGWQTHCCDGTFRHFARKKSKPFGNSRKPVPETTVPALSSVSLCPWTRHKAGGCRGTPPKPWRWVRGAGGSPRLPAPRIRGLPVQGSGSAFASSSSGLSEIKRSSGVCSQPSFTCDPSELRLRQRALFPGPAEGMFYS